MSHSEQKMLYQHMAIISCYLLTVFLKYVNNCNRKFQNTYVLSYCTNQKKVMCQITPQERVIHSVLTYHTKMCLITTQNIDSN